MRLQHKIQMLAALMLLGAGTAANAQKAQEGDVALFVNNISLSPMYNMGYFLNNNVMGYGSLGFTSDDNDSGVRFGLGTRIYGAPGSSDAIRTYWNADLNYAGEGYARAGGLATFGGGLAGQGTETISLAADFGMEAELAPQFTIGAEVGIQWQDVETSTALGSTSNSILSLGTADLTLNYYF